jgi:hypothetical protein
MILRKKRAFRMMTLLWMAEQTFTYLNQGIWSSSPRQSRSLMNVRRYWRMSSQRNKRENWWTSEIYLAGRCLSTSALTQIIRHLADNEYKHSPLMEWSFTIRSTFINLISLLRDSRNKELTCVALCSMSNNM